MSETHQGNLQTSRGTIVSKKSTEKDGKNGRFKRYEFTLNTGKTFNMLGSIKSDNPSLDKKEVLGLVEGADVVIAENQNGKYMNVIGVDVLPQSSKTAPDVLPSNSNTINVPNNTPTPVTVIGTVSNIGTAQQKPSDRDASIVIQAITKSLLEGAGDLYISYSDGYLNLNDKALAQHVRRILELHDELVSERTGN